jgi:hypothetical protein
MDVIELAAERPKPEFKFRYGRTPGRYIFETKDLVIGYDEPLSKPPKSTKEIDRCQELCYYVRWDGCSFIDFDSMVKRKNL